MKIPFIITSTKNKPPKEVAKEVTKAFSFIVGDESEEELKDISRAVRENDKEALTIFGLRKAVHDTCERIKKDREQKSNETKRSGKVTIIFPFKGGGKK